jgi:hypothetical protein
MELRKPEVSIERQTAIGLIVSDEFITEFQPICKPSLFQSKYAKLITEWCISYFLQYGTAPKETIQGIFDSKKDTIRDEATIELIDEFLVSISDEFGRKKFNYKFVLDEAEKYFKKRNMKALSDLVEGLLAEGNIAEAESEIANFYNIARPETQGIDLFNDIEKVKSIMTNASKDSLFSFKGQLGKFVDECCRGELLAFFAPEKRGKSWWLQEIALTAVTKGCNVAFFSLEMNNEKMLTRFAQYFTGRPSKKKHIGCAIPYLTRDGEVKYRKSDKPVLTPSSAATKLTDMKQLIRGATLKLVCWPSDVMTLNDIKFQLDVWKRYDDFIPDVIVVDYADLMACVDKRLEYRHQLDSIWKGLKKLAQETFCFVATASQTTKDTQKKAIHKGSASEDKRKTSHPDRILALNQTEDDKEKQIMRVSVLFDRHDSERSWMEVTVLQQLAIGKPYLGSFIQTKETKEKQDGKETNQKNHQKRTNYARPDESSSQRHERGGRIRKANTGERVKR